MQGGISLLKCIAEASPAGMGALLVEQQGERSLSGR